VFASTVSAQFDYRHQYTYADFDTTHANNLYFRIENNNFFKNDEYFGDYIEGYTLLGADIEPTMVYYAGNKARFKVGVHMRKYSGIDSFSTVLPIISMHARLSRHVDLIMGSLRGNVQHRMPEQIYDPERIYSRPVENGVQFLVNTKRLWADMWIDWDQTILSGDSKPEMFTFGLSGRYNWTNPESSWQLVTPFALLARHKGGQISNFEERMQTLSNSSVGFELKKEWKDRWFQSFMLKSDLLSFRDMRNAAGLPFQHGHGLYVGVGAEAHKFQLATGYFRGENFYSANGSPLFNSISSFKKDVYNKYRNIIMSRLAFHHSVSSDLNFEASALEYFDVDAGQLEYAYGISLIFTPSWFIAKIPIMDL
jgi:hypothetical protein